MVLYHHPNRCLLMLWKIKDICLWTLLEGPVRFGWVLSAQLVVFTGYRIFSESFELALTKCNGKGRSKNPTFYSFIGFFFSSFLC